MQYAPGGPIVNVRDDQKTLSRGETLPILPKEQPSDYIKRGVTVGRSVSPDQQAANISSERAKNIHDIPRNLGNTLTAASLPLLPASIAAAPAATALGIGGSIIGGKAAQKGVELAGGGENAQDWAALGGSVLGGASGGVIGDRFVPSRATIGKTFFNPEGKLTPVGEAIAHPIDKGTEFGLRKLFPPPQPEGVGATEPSAGEFYENKGKDLMRRGTQQATLDRAAARAIPKPIKGAITIGEGAGSTLSNVPRDTAPLTPPTSGLPEGQQNVQFVKDFQKPKIAAQPKGTVDINSGNSSGLPSMVGSGVGEPTPLKPVLVKAFTPQVEEGIPGSTINPKGRQILLPSEVETDAQGNIRPKGYAASKIRAHENGMAYASGARPAYGGKVPRGATPTTTFENPSQPRSVTKFPWLDEEEQ
jgi:hypothetical protein